MCIGSNTKQVAHIIVGNLSWNGRIYGIFLLIGVLFLPFCAPKTHTHTSS